MIGEPFVTDPHLKEVHTPKLPPFATAHGKISILSKHTLTHTHNPYPGAEVEQEKHWLCVCVCECVLGSAVTSIGKTYAIEINFMKENNRPFWFVARKTFPFIRNMVSLYVLVRSTFCLMLSPGLCWFGLAYRMQLFQKHKLQQGRKEAGARRTYTLLMAQCTGARYCSRLAELRLFLGGDPRKLG